MQAAAAAFGSFNRSVGVEYPELGWLFQATYFFLLYSNWQMRKRQQATETRRQLTRTSTTAGKCVYANLAQPYNSWKMVSGLAAISERGRENVKRLALYFGRSKHGAICQSGLRDLSRYLPKAIHKLLLVRERRCAVSVSSLLDGRATIWEGAASRA